MKNDFQYTLGELMTEKGVIGCNDSERIIDIEEGISAGEGCECSQLVYDPRKGEDSLLVYCINDSNEGEFRKLENIPLCSLVAIFEQLKRGLLG